MPLKKHYIRTGIDSSVAVTDSEDQHFLENPRTAPPEVQGYYRDRRETFKKREGAYPEDLYDRDMMD